MSDPIGYNDENFPPLPNEDASWDKMKKLLDEDEKKRRVLPFWLRFSALALLLAGSVIGGYFIWDSYDGGTVGAERQTDSERGNSNTSELVHKQISKDHPAPADGNSATSVTSSGNSSASQSNRNKEDNIFVTDDNVPVKTSASTSTDDHKPATSRSNTSKVRVINQKINTQGKQDINSSGARNSMVAGPKNVVRKTTSAPVRPSDKKDPNKQDVTAANDGIDQKVTADEPQTDLSKIATDTIGRSQIDTKKDTVVTKPETANPTDTTKLKEAVADKKEKTRKRDPWSWSMGVTLQEPVAIGSQQSSDYNYTGKRSWVGDHLPGIYFSASKRKWTLSGQFNYRVPQPVEQVPFSQSTKYDPANTTLKTEKFSIEKLYYHQFAATGSYALHPRISAEIGGGYNLLAGAVTRRDLKSTEVITGNTTTYNELAPVKGYKDSFLFRSTAATLAGVNYHWKKLQIGVRYGFALQPFMRYTSPDGTVEDVRNNTLMLTARLRIWERRRP